MCSFTVTNNSDVNLDSTNYFSKKQGPDFTYIKNINRIYNINNFIHNTI